MTVSFSKISTRIAIVLLSGALSTLGAMAQKAGYGYYDGPSSQAQVQQNTMGRPSAFDGINYDLMEMGYRYMMFDDDQGLLDDGHAISFDLSLDLLWYFFIEAEVLYGTTNTEVNADKFFDLDESGNYTEFELGIGGHFPLTDRFHLVASGGFYYENQDLSGDVFEDVDGIIDGGGIYLKPGVRMLLTDSLEAGAFLDYTKLSDADEGNWGVSGSLIYKVTDAIGISGNVQLKEDVSTIGAGIRLSW